MKQANHVLGAALIVLGFATFDAAAQSRSDMDVQELGNTLPDVHAVAEGLFPEDACEQLKAAGFKCMGYKPALRYALPVSSFRAGSAEVPDTLKKQLDVFAEVLRSRKGGRKAVRIEGHTDASGAPAANVALSQRRAEAVRDYLVERGADPAMLSAVGLGSSEPRDPRNPLAPENRRIEIVRAPTTP
jgi:outer membrane protein OmpA-like peptidoglycan-associated protein